MPRHVFFPAFISNPTIEPCITRATRDGRRLIIYILVQQADKRGKRKRWKNLKFSSFDFRMGREQTNNFVMLIGQVRLSKEIHVDFL